MTDGATTQSNSVGSRLRLIPFDKISLSREAPYLVKGWLPRTGLAVMWGKPKCGKSFLALDLSMHVALGWPWGKYRAKRGSVVYVACEGGEGMKARIEAFRQEKLSEECGPIPFFLLPCKLDLVAEQGELITAIGQKEPSPVLVVIDTLNRSMPGSENSDEDMSIYITAATAVAEAFDCLVTIVHHCGKENSGPRGHSSLTGAADSQIAVRCNRQTGMITAEVEYMKDGPEGATICCQLRPVELGYDEDGDPITSCLLDVADIPAFKSGDKGLPHQTRIAFCILKELSETGSEVQFDEWRERFMGSDAVTSEKQDSRARAFKRAVDKLEEADRIDVRDGVVRIKS